MSQFLYSSNLDISNTLFYYFIINTYVLDLLEGGKTPGESVRYLLSPNLRPKKEENAAGEASKTAASLGKGEGEDEPSEFSYRETKEALDSPDLDRSQYNMVVYGLPNIVVVQQ